MIVNRKRIRFLERDYVKKKIKNATTLLDEEDIERILEEHEWCDLTFIFDIREHGIKTLVFDNAADHEMALLDLNINSREFYEKQIHELSGKKYIESIRTTLHMREVVRV